MRLDICTYIHTYIGSIVEINYVVYIFRVAQILTHIQEDNEIVKYRGYCYRLFLKSFW